jgi:hypothetical protein
MFARTETLKHTCRYDFSEDMAEIKPLFNKWLGKYKKDPHGRYSVSPLAYMLLNDKRAP